MKRPLTVIIIGWFFIAAGTVGLLYHLQELNVHDAFSNDAVWVLFLRLLAIVAGILVLRGSNAGRWLLVLWIAYHVVLSYFHTFSEMMLHIILLAAVVYALFHRKVTPFFTNSPL
jgi:hypothetical protein